jgi:hypothetical protein
MVYEVLYQTESSSEQANSPQSTIDVGISNANAIMAIGIRKGSVIKSHTPLILNEVVFFAKVAGPDIVLLTAPIIIWQSESIYGN